MEQNLPELRDIHLPDGVSPFPPAYGWWVILGSVLLLLVLTELFLIIRRKSKNVMRSTSYNIFPKITLRLPPCKFRRFCAVSVSLNIKKPPPYTGTLAGIS